MLAFHNTAFSTETNPTVQDSVYSAGSFSTMPIGELASRGNNISAGKAGKCCMTLPYDYTWSGLPRVKLLSITHGFLHVWECGHLRALLSCHVSTASQQTYSMIRFHLLPRLETNVTSLLSCTTCVGGSRSTSGRSRWVLCVIESLPLNWIRLVSRGTCTFVCCRPS